MREEGLRVRIEAKRVLSSPPLRRRMGELEEGRWMKAVHQASRLWLWTSAMTDLRGAGGRARRWSCVDLMPGILVLRILTSPDDNVAVSVTVSVFETSRRPTSRMVGSH